MEELKKDIAEIKENISELLRLQYNKILKDCHSIGTYLCSEKKDTRKGILKHIFKNQEIEQLENEKQNLREVISRKEQEIKDIKKECAAQFEIIKNLCFANNYGGIYTQQQKLEKIYEIASGNFSALVKDMVINETDEVKKAKMIELSKCRQQIK